MSKTILALLNWSCVAICTLAAALVLLYTRPGALFASGAVLLPLVMLVMLLKPFRFAGIIVPVAATLTLAAMDAFPPLIRERSLTSPVATALVSLTPAVLAFVGARLHRALAAVSGALTTQKTAIEELSLHDELTGAMTRRYAQTHVDEEIARARRYRRPLTLAHFRPVDWDAARDRRTDRQIEDIVRAAAGQILGTVRVMDKVFRVDEAEFLVLLPETPLTGAEVITERLVSQIDQAATVPFAAGVASFPDDGDDAVTLIAETSEAARFAAAASLRVASQYRAA